MSQVLGGRQIEVGVGTACMGEMRYQERVIEDNLPVYRHQQNKTVYSCIPAHACVCTGCLRNSSIHFFSQTLQDAISDVVKAGPPPPLEAILVIFGRRALIFFLFESS